MTSTFRCWVEIDREALRFNARGLRERIGSAEMLAVVKANAYGFGMVDVARTLADEVELFGVANLEEAIALRQSLPHPIIILGPALPDERRGIVEGGFIPTVSTLEEAEDFSRIAERNPHLDPLSAPPSCDPGEEGAPATGERRVSINFKIDTGMGRMGAVEAEALNMFKRIAALPKIKLHSVSTHLPVSNEDANYTREQLVRFGKDVKEMRAAVPGKYKAHVLQSAGSLAFNQTPFEIVRAGIVLYGISPLPEFQNLFKPVMIWKTRIGLVREVPKGRSISYGRTFITPRAMRVATLTAGYADGYPRHLSNVGAAVLIRGKRCPLLGRVTMDLIVVDVSEIKDVEVGEEVVLMGQQGDEEVCCAELADRAGTITWDITTRIGARVRRVYV